MKKNVPSEEILKVIDDNIMVVNNTISNLSEKDFEKDFPLEKHGKIVKTDFMLLHLIWPLSDHLGQINYHRRLIEY